MKLQDRVFLGAATRGELRRVPWLCDSRGGAAGSATPHGLPGEAAHHLASKFGTAAEKVLALATETATLLDPILERRAAIKAEVVYAVRYEMAAAIEDVLARRIGMQLYSWRDAIQAAPVVGSLMAEELQWTSVSTELATSRYVEKINHLLDSAGLSRKRSPATMNRESSAAQR